VEKLVKSSVEAAEIAGQRFYLNISSRFSGLQGGNRFGRNTGNSLEFLDHREYQPGDDVRHIDWNAMARSDRLTVKLFREEISPHLDILIDASLSMAGETFHKSAAVMALAALLRVAAFNAGYTVSCWMLKDRCRRIEPASIPLAQWQGAEFDYCGNVGETITSFPPRLRNNGARILLSDLFWNQEPVSVLRQLSNGAALLTVVQMLAKEDVAPELAGNIRLIDCETSEAVELIADESLIAEYLRNFTRHQEYWKKCCSKYGAVFTHCIGEELLNDFVPVELLKTEIIMARS